MQTTAKTTAKVVIGNTRLQLTNKVGLEVVRALRKHGRIGRPKATPPEPLVKRLYNVRGGPLRIKRKLTASELNQTIVHFNSPDHLPDRRQCGVPVTVALPDLGLEIETRLIPQWRFGAGMRGGIIKAAMEGKTEYELVEKDGKLVLTFK